MKKIFLLLCLGVLLVGCGDTKPRSAMYDPTSVTQSNQTVSSNDVKDDPPKEETNTQTETQSTETSQPTEWKNFGVIESYKILDNNIVFELKQKDNRIELVKVPWVNGIMIKIGEQFQLNHDQSQWTQESNTNQYGTGWASN
jgi:hypothetical protein